MSVGKRHLFLGGSCKFRDCMICPFEVVLGLLLLSECLMFGQPEGHNSISSLNPTVSPSERAESLCHAFSVTSDKIGQAASVSSLASEKWKGLQKMSFFGCGSGVGKDKNDFQEFKNMFWPSRRAAKQLSWSLMLTKGNSPQAFPGRWVSKLRERHQRDLGGIISNKWHPKSTRLKVPPFLSCWKLVAQDVLKDFADLYVQYFIKHIQPCAYHCGFCIVGCIKGSSCFSLCGVFFCSLFLPHMLIESFIRDGKMLVFFFFEGCGWVGFQGREQLG